MLYKAWISRMLGFADESIQIVIEDTDTLESLKQRVFDALKVTDFRANTQLQRLFEDAELTNELTYSQLQAARDIAKLMYPLEKIPSKLDLGNKTAFEFSKNLSGGEVLKLYIHDFESYESLTDAIKTIWDIIDARLKKTNKREIDTQKYYKSLTFETQHKVGMIMQLLYGKAFTESIVEALRKEKVKETVTSMRGQVIEENNNGA